MHDRRRVSPFFCDSIVRLHIPYRMTAIYWILWETASPGTPTIQFRWFMLLRVAELSGTRSPGGTIETYLPPFFYRTWSVARGIEPEVDLLGPISFIFRPY